MKVLFIVLGAIAYVAVGYGMACLCKRIGRYLGKETGSVAFVLYCVTWPAALAAFIYRAFLKALDIAIWLYRVLEQAQVKIDIRGSVCIYRLVGKRPNLWHRARGSPV